MNWRLQDPDTETLAIKLRRRPIEAAAGTAFSNEAWNDLKSIAKAYAVAETRFRRNSETRSVRSRVDLVEKFATDLLSAGYYSSGSP